MMIRLSMYILLMQKSLDCVCVESTCGHGVLDYEDLHQQFDNKNCIKLNILIF